MAGLPYKLNIALLGASFCTEILVAVLESNTKDEDEKPSSKTSSSSLLLPLFLLVVLLSICCSSYAIFAEKTH